jgi:vacuolar-type H+-ATPase subunit E/Vma4
MSNDEKSYLPYLVSTTAEAIRELGLSEVLIKVNEKDLKQIDKNGLERAIETKLPARVKIVWSKDPIEALGGAIISNVDGKIRINSTFDQKFQALESKLLTEAGRLLFRNNA